jgi:hypothetical protein
MANPRAVLVHDDIGYRAITMKIDGATITYDATKKGGSASVGLAVGAKAATAQTVELVTTNQAVLGKLDKVEPDGFCTVQIEGQCYLPGATSQALANGGKFVGGLLVAARGYIKEPDTTSAATLLPARHEVLDAATATAISVMLGD